MTIPADPKPVAITGAVATLTPENSKIEFIGTHAGARPDPRLGGFEKFTGQADADPETKTLKSVSMEIDAKSVWTQVGGPLTNHLKNADFFDVNEFPNIIFKSTNIDATDAPEGKYTLTGELTLHGVTKAIGIPATVKIGADGLTLISQFTIDRTEFGMTAVLDRVEKAVSLTVVIGDKTQPQIGGGFGGPGRGGPGGFRGGPPGAGGPPGGGGPPGTRLPEGIPGHSTPMKPLLESVLVPAVVSVVTTIGILRGFSGDVSRRYTGSLAFAAGFLAGFAFLETRELRPSTYWHWLPWVAVVASIVGPIGLAAGVRPPERLALLIVLTLVAAWFLVPTWASLQPTRGGYIAAFAGSVFLLWFLLDPLAGRVPHALLCGTLVLSSLNGGVLVAAFVSVRFGLLGVAAAAALSGPFVAAILYRDDAILRGLLPVHVVVLGGIMLAAQVNVGLPSATLVLIPAAPLIHWLCEIGPLARLHGKWRSVVRFGAIGLPLAVAWGLSLSAQRERKPGRGAPHTTVASAVFVADNMPLIEPG